MILISTKGCFLMIGFVGAIVLWGCIFLHSLTLFISIWKCPTNKKSAVQSSIHCAILYIETGTMSETTKTIRQLPRRVFALIAINEWTKTLNKEKLKHTEGIILLLVFWDRFISNIFMYSLGHGFCWCRARLCTTIVLWLIYIARSRLWFQFRLQTKQKQCKMQNFSHCT